MGLRKLSQEEIAGIPDFYERLAAEKFSNVGLDVFEGPMVVAPRAIGKKRATVPDLLVSDGKQFRYVEITRSNVRKSPKKNRQKDVMQRAGLTDQYVQLGGEEMESILCTSNDLNLLDKILDLLRLR